MQKRSTENMKKEYEDAMGQAATVAFISIVRRHPDVELGEVFDLAKDKGLEHLTIQQVFHDDNFMDFSKAPKALAAPGKNTNGTSLSLRTVAQREAYRLKMVDAMSREWMPSRDIRDAGPGGNAMQVRNCLNGLIEEGIVEFRGNTAATQYRLSKKGMKLRGGKR